MAFGLVNPVDEQLVPHSKPVDTTAPYDTASLAGKTVVITGGASGFGAAFARKWAKAGAYVALGDLNDALGEKLVAELRTTTPGGEHHIYRHCDVTDWQSQCDLFRAAIENSPSGRIHIVVPNAGIADRDSPVTGRGFENPTPDTKSAAGAAGEEEALADPKLPKLAVVQVNLIGVMHTVHLAEYWLQKTVTPKGSAVATPPPKPSDDRAILLISSVAGIMPLAGQVQYTAAKHGVTGMFRALRNTAHRQNIRVNMLCPYFVETNILPAAGLAMLAGGGLAEADDVVDAGTRLVADESIVGRALTILPRMYMEGEGAAAARAAGIVPDLPTKVVGAPASASKAAVGTTGDGQVRAVWEVYGEDFANCEVFVQRYIKMMNAVTVIRGWKGYIQDLIHIFFFRNRDTK